MDYDQPAADTARHISPRDAWKYTAAAFLARGLSIMEVSRRTGKARDTIRGLPSELIAAEVRAFTSPDTILDELVPKAAATYHHALDEHDTTVARDVFDRKWGKPKLNESDRSPVSVSITFVDKQLVVHEPEHEG